MTADDFALLKYDTILMIWMRFVEFVSVIVFFITCYAIHAHSHNSVGVYKYCLYQIIFWPFLSQAVLIFGPVLVFPIIGVYHYIDFTDSPAVVHGILSVWALICCFDIQSILDGFTFRLRVILHAFHPNLANKYFWITVVALLKVTAIVFCVFFIAPIGKYLNRIDMRTDLIECYPSVVDTFDSYKSFVVYDIEALTGFKQCIVIMSIFMGVFCIYGGSIVLAIFIILYLHRANMSESTRRLHARFVTQLSVQGSVPFVVMICPLIAILALTLMKFQFVSNSAGYAITVFLIMHSPLTSLTTIFIYDSYRKGVIGFINKKILCRTSVHVQINASVSNVVSAMEKRHDE